MNTQEIILPHKRAVPEALQAPVQERWERYREACAAERIQPVSHPELVAVLKRVWACSPFVAEACIRAPAALADLVRSGDLLIACPMEEYRRKVAAATARAADADELGRRLRLLRRREMVRIAWRDLAGWAAVQQTIAELSDFAEACIDGAVGWLHQSLQRAHGAPRGEDGDAAQSLVVIAMGKLGARELNFSSDVDLIFCYPEDGVTRGRRRGMSNQQFFIELGQQLIKVLSEITDDGFVFRIDMRLRPFGESGPLAVSFDALEDYYQSHGRPWERYAMVRGRPITGMPKARAQLMDILRPFVYRRYLDYTAFQELREVKQRIVQDVARRDMEHNIKLGAGGIREIEFIVHTFQIIRGGRQVELQAYSLLAVIDELEKSACLAPPVCADLRDDYLYLRRLENHIQAFADRQEHNLPGDGPTQDALAYSMGVPDWMELQTGVARRRQRVHDHFDNIISVSQTRRAGRLRSPWCEMWQDTLDDARAVEALVAAGMDDPEQVLALLDDMRGSARYRAMTARGREHLDHLMPLLLAAVVEYPQPAATLRRLLELIEEIGQRTAYLALLVEYPGALSQLVKLFSASAWIAEYITRHPLLLDELLDARRLYAPLDRSMLDHALQLEQAHIPHADLEQQMEALRHFKQANTLRVAAADVAGVFPLMVVSDHLTEIAEVILRAVYDLAWRHFVSKHGHPGCRVDGKRRPARFGIVGYGKLGGIELGYGSDLDLVFLHDSAGEAQSTDGPKVIDNAVFFARLGQRIIHMLNTFTPSGILYEVDMRLRPSGASGLLVSSLDSFADYQHHQAWTWEHQALVRARPVAGDSGVCEGFAAIRRAVLTRVRDPASLRVEVRDMRERMRAAHGGRDATLFDLKQDRGGIADIEFMVQYEILRWGHDYPDLLKWTDNIRQLDGLADASLMPQADVQLLKDAYRFYRAIVHRLTLQEAPGVVGLAEVEAYRPGVTRLWHGIMDGAE
jgi:glutamate-ammonia-ligase adenylyltransferase